MFGTEKAQTLRGRCGVEDESPLRLLDFRHLLLPVVEDIDASPAVLVEVLVASMLTAMRDSDSILRQLALVATFSLDREDDEQSASNTYKTGYPHSSPVRVVGPGALFAFESFEDSTLMSTR